MSSPRPDRAPQARTAAIAFLACTALFAVSSTRFIAAPTDLSAWRVLSGDVPYRDFWTMYAPGSFTVLSWLYAAFGREMMVTRIAGGLTAAAAMAIYALLASRIGGVRAVALPVAMSAIAFFTTGYHTRFGSYPPALALLLGAVLLLSRPPRPDAGDPRREVWRLVAAGLLGGGAVLFKHDVAGYGLIALAVAVLVTGGVSWAPRVRAVVTLTAVASIPPAAACLWFWRHGALAPMVDALVTFPLTDFPLVRPESFPLLPQVSGDVVADIRSVVHWLECQAPSATLLAGLLALWKRGRRDLPLAWWWALAVYPFFWTAAHVQLNTHAISLTAVAWLVASAALVSPRTAADPASPLAAREARGGHGATSRAWRPLWGVPVAVWAAAAVWAGALAIEPGYRTMVRWWQGPQAMDLPHLAGIAEPPADRAWVRGLAAAIASAAPPDAPLLLVAARNDTVVFVDLSPYWLSARRPATRFHELHPAITDTDAGQREMLAQIALGPPPVVVRELRFGDDVIEAVKRRFQASGVAVGATALDAWITAHYEPGDVFDRYQIMRPRVAADGRVESGERVPSQ